MRSRTRTPRTGEHERSVAPNVTEATPSEERRQRNPTLRRLVDSLLEHVRELSEEVDHLPPEELAEAQRRFLIMAELMWAAITDEKKRPSRAVDRP